MLRNKLISAAVVGAFALPGAVLAADAAPASPHTFTSNVGFVTDYSFRGISQTMGEPAVQGGFDYAHSSGLYLGLWGSNVSGTQFTDGNLETDWYGGWAKTWGDWGLNVGALYYFYPGAKIATNGDKYDTLEGYASVSWKWISAKLSYAFTDFFGCNANSCGPNYTGSSDGSTYIEVNATYPVTEAFSITGHVGHQAIEGTAVDYDYTDYKIGVNYLYNGFNFGLAYKDTDADSALYTAFKASGKEVDLSEGTVIFSVSKTF